MKKILAAVLLAALLLVTVAACADGYSVAGRAASIPDQVQALLNKENLDGYTVTSYAESSGYGFAVLQGNGKNVLYVFGQKNGAWSLQYKTRNALKQGRGLTLVQADDYNGGIVITYDYDHDYAAEYFSPSWLLTMHFQLSRDGAWRLRFYRDEDKWISIDVNENRLAYYGGTDAEEFQGSAYGTFQNDLRFLSLSNIPGSLKEARKGLTLAPSLPAGTLGAEVIEFKGGQKFDVYSGPGTNYLRGANGKACVSTNDWIQVFGTEDGWIMVQYAINNEHYRIGYIQEKALPKNAYVEALNLPAAMRYTSRAVDVTDDPLFSCTPLARLGEGAEVTLLGTLGDFAYIEGYASGMFRGFVPTGALVDPEPVTVPIEQQKESEPEGNYNGQMLDPYGLQAVWQKIVKVIGTR